MVKHKEAGESRSSRSAGFRKDPANIKALWIAVVIQAIADATNTSAKLFKRNAKRDAIDWIRDESGNGDFDAVCELAELDPTYLRPLIDDMLTGKRSVPDFRALRECHQEIRQILEAEEQDEEQLSLDGLFDPTEF